MKKCLVPSNLNMRKLLERHPITGNLDNHKDSVYFICHSIMKQMEFLKGKQMVHKEKKLPYFVPLSSVWLKKQLGSRIYKPTLLWMVKANIIESDHSWQSDKVSMGYRFTDHYLGASHKWVTLTSELGKKIASIKISDKNPFCPQVISRLQKWFNPEVLTIDVKAARKEIRKIYDEDMAIASKQKKPEKRTRLILSARTKARKNENAVMTFKSGNYSFSQDEFGFRFHSPLTRISKRLRRFIRCKGEELIQLDISGSQLYFGNYFFGEKLLLSSNNRINNKIYSKYNTIMFPQKFIKSLKTQASKGFHNNLYFEKTVTGLFYESIVTELETINFFPENYSPQQKRKKVKKTLLAMLFGDKMDYEQRGLYNEKNIKILTAFETLFPEEANLFNTIKGISPKALCLLLQRIESICMLGLVCKRLQNEFPHIPIYTIHDCIATTSQHISTVRNIMEEEFAKLLGEAPKIDESSWMNLAA